MGVQMRVESPCPACGQRQLDYTSTDLDIPHFPNALQLVFECQACGFRHSDFMIGATRDPTRFTYDAKGPDAMMVRVVRSTSGTVRIPELGILIEPGPASDAYVSNIEGVLARVEAILVQLERDAESDEQREACRDRLVQMRAAREGKFPFTFILEDPFGNSALLHADARSEPIPPTEVEGLKTGTYTLDLQESLPGDAGGNGHGNGHGTGAA